MRKRHVWEIHPFREWMIKHFNLDPFSVLIVFGPIIILIGLGLFAGWLIWGAAISGS